MASILRQAVRAAPRQTRLFSSSVVARKDLVQDMYLRELKAYKPPVQAKDAHLQHVKQYSAPASPTAPALPGDLASELAAYDAQEPAEAVVASSASAAALPVGISAADAFLAHLEEDVHEEAHH